MGTVWWGIAGGADITDHLSLRNRISVFECGDVVLQVCVVICVSAAGIDFVDGVAAGLAQPQSGDFAIAGSQYRRVARGGDIYGVVKIFAAQLVKLALNAFWSDARDGKDKIFGAQLLNGAQAFGTGQDHFIRRYGPGAQQMPANQAAKERCGCVFPDPQFQGLVHRWYDARRSGRFHL